MNKPNYFMVVAATIDGYIARFSGHKVDWTSKEDKKHLHRMENSADVLLLGKTSFEVAKNELSKKNCLILTSKVSSVEKKTGFATYLNPKKVDFKKFVEKSGYKRICVLGGRGAYNYCLQKNLVDDIFLTIEPIVFGHGIGMFEQKVVTKKFKLVSVKKLNKSGTLLLHYSKN